ncbi:hypothetical protein F4779DRAFT_614006 [Xylariaceae sp. FL0662B]|nr:hypothetical protein F4779DRAFT_614006 [Xylariaceae sp. FL0662B]
MCRNRRMFWHCGCRYQSNPSSSLAIELCTAKQALKETFQPYAPCQERALLPAVHASLVARCDHHEALRVREYIRASIWQPALRALGPVPADEWACVRRQRHEIMDDFPYRMWTSKFVRLVARLEARYGVRVAGRGGRGRRRRSGSHGRLRGREMGRAIVAPDLCRGYLEPSGWELQWIKGRLAIFIGGRQNRASDTLWAVVFIQPIG